MLVGDKVFLNIPENPRLHNTLAEVIQVTTWGAICNAPAAATEQFRALHSEMRSYQGNINPNINHSNTTGDFCDRCGSSQMVRTGTCLTCQECGNSSGGCS